MTGTVIARSNLGHLPAHPVAIIVSVAGIDGAFVASDDVARGVGQEFPTPPLSSLAFSAVYSLKDSFAPANVSVMDDPLVRSCNSSGARSGLHERHVVDMAIFADSLADTLSEPYSE